LILPSHMDNISLVGKKCKGCFDWVGSHWFPAAGLVQIHHSLYL